MADGQANASGPSLHRSSSSSLAVERLKWAIRPMGLLFLMLWIFHPSTVDHADYVRMALLGFLAGVFYGLAVYGRKLQKYILINNQNQTFKQNRVPEEYYWGNVVQMMFDNR